MAICPRETVSGQSCNAMALQCWRKKLLLLEVLYPYLVRTDVKSGKDERVTICNLERHTIWVSRRVGKSVRRRGSNVGRSQWAFWIHLLSHLVLPGFRDISLLPSVSRGP